MQNKKRSLVVLSLVLLTTLIGTGGLILNVMSTKSTDINADGVVDMKDVALAASAFGSFSGHARWNREADINEDGRVSLKDICHIILDFGLVI
ncbi:MAG: hypothetical protein JSW72_05345 [Candidatus Bathyarchaeota archaeon]|nr:MAG: hypothetical protein JSW72_05345 [Candidatus Bathyarchaeota archaeon]